MSKGNNCGDSGHIPFLAIDKRAKFLSPNIKYVSFKRMADLELTEQNHWSNNQKMRRAVGG